MTPDFTPASTASIGQRLRVARTTQGLSIADAAERLKLPAVIVEAMERDDRAVLGAAVFARGRLGNYARLVGLPQAIVDAQFTSGTVAPPPLVSSARDTRFERGLQRFARRGVAAVLTATIILPVIWLATRHGLPQTPEPLAVLDVSQAAGRHTAKPATRRTSPNPQPPVAASMAPFAGYRGGAENEPAAVQLPTTAATAATSAQATEAAVVAPDENGLQLRFDGDSWVELTGAGGQPIERGMIHAGSVRSYHTGAIARVVIGNVASVRVLQDGQPLDLSAFSHANLARFTLSSAGKPAPAAD